MTIESSLIEPMRPRRQPTSFVVHYLDRARPNEPGCSYVAHRPFPQVLRPEREKELVVGQLPIAMLCER